MMSRAEVCDTMSGPVNATQVALKRVIKLPGSAKGLVALTDVTLRNATHSAALAPLLHRTQALGRVRLNFRSTPICLTRF